MQHKKSSEEKNSDKNILRNWKEGMRNTPYKSHHLHPILHMLLQVCGHRVQYISLKKHPIYEHPHLCWHLQSDGKEHSNGQVPKRYQ